MIHLRGVLVKPTGAEIIAAVGFALGVPVEDLRRPGAQQQSKGRTLPRQIATYFVRNMTDYSYPKIASLFNQDHTTILYGHRRITTAVVEENEKICFCVELARNELIKRGYLL